MILSVYYSGKQKGLILLQYVFNSVKYFLESILGAYSLFMHAQLQSKFNLKKFYISH